MADELIGLLSPNDLLGFSQRVEASDPYGLIGRSLQQWQPNYETFNATESFATAFGKAFLSGLATNYAQNRAADQVSKVVNVLPQLGADPYSVSAPEGVDAGPFNLLKGSAILKSEARKASAASEGQRTVGDLLKSILGEGVKAGTITPASALEAAKTGRIEEVLGSSQSDALKNPNSPDYKRNQDLFKIEQSYTDKLLTGAEPQRVMAMNRAATNILDAIKKDNPLAASTAIFEYAKLQDPAGTVREADEMRVSDPGGPLGILAQIHNQITGEGKLTSDAKKSMRELVPILQENTFTQYNQLRDSYLEAAKEYGADPARIKYLKPADLSGYLTESSSGIPNEAAIKGRLSLILQKAESGAPLSEGEKAFVAEVKAMRAGGM